MPSSKIENFVEIYTDGACSGNPGPGGWGALLLFAGKRKEVLGHDIETTNNKMELTAAIAALQCLKKPCKIKLYTDSKYVQQGITVWVHNWQRNNWRRKDNKPVKNADLWQELYSAIQQHDITWCRVKGHSDNEGNNIADALAVRARDNAKREFEQCH